MVVVACSAFEGEVAGGELLPQGQGAAKLADSLACHYCGFDPYEVVAYREVAVVVADMVVGAVTWVEKKLASEVDLNQAAVVEDASFSFQYSLPVAATVVSVYLYHYKLQTMAQNDRETLRDVLPFGGASPTIPVEHLASADEEDAH